ncbi:MAG: ABC transporter permease [Bacteroidota bacterium]
MITSIRQTWAFVFRNFHLLRRYMSWVVVFTFYEFVNAATIVLIGVAVNEPRLTITLILGVMLWNFLSAMFHEISNSISWERWEGTLEYTFMAPVSRFTHLLGVSIYAVLYSLVNSTVVLLGLLLFVDINLSGANMSGVLVVVLTGSVAFTGLGLMAAVLPVMSPEHGAQAANIFQGVLLLISGIYYPVSVLPVWLQPLSYISPATYVLSASRTLIGLDEQSGEMLETGGQLSEVIPELTTLAIMGVVMVPLGLWIFGKVEAWAKKTGKLKRTG